MSHTINLLIKIFKCEKYLNDFLDGNLYIGSLKKFAEIQGDTTQADPLEGITGIYQPEHARIKIRHQKLNIDYTIPSEDYSGAIHSTLTDKDLLKLKALCFYSPLIDINSLENVMDSIHISDKMRKDFGELVVIIPTPQVFIDRVLETAKNEKISCETRFPNYFSKNETISFDHQSIGFNKEESYAFQKEFRMLFHTNEESDHLRLNIGDIRDLCMVLTVDQFNDGLEFDIQPIQQ